MMVILLVLCVSMTVASPFRRFSTFSTDAVSVFPAVADPPTVCSGRLVCQERMFSLNFTSYDEHRFFLSRPPCLDAAARRLVVQLSCNVSAGRQFDRSVFVTLEGAAVLTGTTSEPTRRAGPAWSVESDVTEFGALLRGKGTLSGTVQLGTVFDGTYNGLPACTATLIVYQRLPATARLPDVVVPLATRSEGGLEANVPPLPSTLSSLELHLMVQGQGGDEFWWSCVPSNLSKALGTCGNTAFRAVEVRVNGVVVALAMPFPYIFTGGLDPLLWIPTPAPQTLLLQPLRVVVPAGFFPPARNATVTISVGPQSNSFWNVGATLFGRLDPGVVGRGIVSHVEPSAGNVSVVVSLNSTTLSGTVAVAFASRVRTLEYVDRSGGVRETFLTQRTVNFTNAQSFATNGTSAQLVVVRQHTGWREKRSRVSDNVVTHYQDVVYPFFASIEQEQAALLHMTSHIDLAFRSVRGSALQYRSEVWDRVAARDTLVVNATGGGFRIVGNSNQTSHQEYQFTDNRGSCFRRHVSASNNSNAVVNTVCDKIDLDANPFK